MYHMNVIVLMTCCGIIGRPEDFGEGRIMQERLNNERVDDSGMSLC
jgi:hypothetical protein